MTNVFTHQEKGDIVLYPFIHAQIQIQDVILQMYEYD